MTEHLELDLTRIATADELLQSENLQFRRFVKDRIESRKLDKLVKEIYSEVARQIDCTQCGNCCREAFPTQGEEFSCFMRAFF